uniref:Serpentine receptor class gamma n=1 Tax=Strongyloides stercoralis TaxID=6248 RepID=A0A913IFD7_STRER
MLVNSVFGILLKVYFGLCFIIDIFSFFLYVLILIFIGNRLIKKKNLHSIGFYKLILLNGILDLIYIVEEYIIYRIPQVGLFEHFYIDIFPNLSICRIFSSYAQSQIIFASLTGITITLNRFIAIKYPSKYDYFWSGWRLILLCTWPFLIAVPMFVYFFEKEVAYMLTSSGSITLYYKEYYLNYLVWQILVIIDSSALCINIVFNIILIYTIKKSDILSKLSNNKKKEMKLEISLAKFAVIYCTFFSIVVCAEICMIIAINLEAINVAEDIYTSFGFVETVFIFFTPYTLLYLSYDFRQKFLLFIGYSKLWFFGIKSKTLVKTIKIPANVIKSKFSSSRS